MTTKEFIVRLDSIKDPGRLAGLKRVFGSGGAEIAGLKTLAQLGVTIADHTGSIPYKIVAYMHGRGIANEKTGSIAKVLHAAAMLKEKGASESGELSFDKRFDALVACRDYHTLKVHLIQVIPFLDEHHVDYALFLDDLKNWSASIRDKWIETYYQA